MKQKRGISLAIHLLVVFLIVIAVLPVAYMVSHAFKPTEVIQQLYTSQQNNIGHKVWTLPFIISFGQWSRIFFKTPQFLYMFWNSLIMIIPIVVFQMLFSIMAAYGFSKRPFKGASILFFIYMVAMLMPFQVTLVPHYLILNKLHLMNHYGSLILPGVFGTFGTFYIKQFMDGIDRAYIEEAIMLGAKDRQILWQILVPMCKPIETAAAVFIFLDYYNMVEQPIHFISVQERQPLSVYLARIADGNMDIAFACSCLYMVLPILITFYAQNDLKDSMRLGNLK